MNNGISHKNIFFYKRLLNTAYKVLSLISDIYNSFVFFMVIAYYKLYLEIINENLYLSIILVYISV